jgi:transcriptional regulator GlxA family with amidase domain
VRQWAIAAALGYLLLISLYSSADWRGLSQVLNAERQEHRLAAGQLAALPAVVRSAPSATGQAEALAAPNRSAAIVAEAEAWMTARLEQPLRIADLARALELTTSSLQLAFQRECGCSPLQRLKRLRFQALHRPLERPDSGVLSLDILFGPVGLPRHGRTRQEFGSWCGSLPSDHRQLALLRQPYPRSSTGKISVTKE